MLLFSGEIDYAIIIFLHFNIKDKLDARV